MLHSFLLNPAISFSQIYTHDIRKLPFNLPFIKRDLISRYRHLNNRLQLLSFNIRLQSPRPAVARRNNSTILLFSFYFRFSLSLFFTLYPSSTLHNTKFSLPSFVPPPSPCRFFFRSPNTTQSQYTFLLALVMAHLPKRAFSLARSNDVLLTPTVIDFLA